jgi:hypothetical protein
VLGPRPLRRGPSGATWLGLFFLAALAAGVATHLPASFRGLSTAATRAPYQSAGVKLLAEAALAGERIPQFAGDGVVVLLPATGAAPGTPLLAAAIIPGKSLALTDMGPVAQPAVYARGMGADGLLYLGADGSVWRLAEGAPPARLPATLSGRDVGSAAATPRLVGTRTGFVMESLGPAPRGGSTWGATTLAWFDRQGRPAGSAALPGTAVMALTRAGEEGLAAGMMSLRQGEVVFSLARCSRPGSVDWEYQIGRDAIRQVVAGPDGRQVAAATTAEVLAFSSAGERLWRTSLPGVVGLAFNSEGQTVALTVRGEVSAWTPNGKKAWASIIPGRGLALEATGAGELVAVTTSGAVCLRADGKAAWVVAPPGTTRWVALSPGGQRIAVVTAQNVLSVYERTGGR